MPAYNPFQGWNYIEESALAFGPDVVVVQFTETNDLEPFMPRSGQTAWKGLKRWVRRHMHVSTPLLEVYGKATGLGRGVSLTRPAADEFTVRLRTIAGGYYRERQSVIERNESGWRQAEQSFRRSPRS